MAQDTLPMPNMFEFYSKHSGLNNHIRYKLIIIIILNK